MKKNIGYTLASLAILTAILFLSWWIWDPYPTTEQRFDKGMNGVWIGHQWFTGRTVKTGRPISAKERQALVDRLRQHRIRYVFVHAGPVRKDGTINDHPSPFFFQLTEDYPEGRFLPWLGSRVDTSSFNNADWAASVIDALTALQRKGIAGAHFDFEPLRDNHAEYVAFLKTVREKLGPRYFISHATRRAGPYGISFGPLRKNFWSKDFYEQTMQHTNQTVLMAYNTTLDIEKNYVGFVKHETNLLLDYSCQFDQHSVLIGIPGFEDAPRISNPSVENIGNGIRGVRAALETRQPCVSTFDGVAIYADWVTNRDEWSTYRRLWLDNQTKRNIDPDSLPATQTSNIHLSRNVDI